jgi:hypothetical protein
MFYVLYPFVTYLLTPPRITPASAWRNWEKTLKTRQDSRFSGQGFHPGPPEYDAGIMTTRSRYPILSSRKKNV